MKDKNYYLSKGFNLNQYLQIDDGVKRGLDVSKYDNVEFDYFQMQQIKFGLMDKVDVSIFAKKEYKKYQMEFIRWSLKQKYNYKYLLNTNFSYELCDKIYRTIMMNDPKISIEPLTEAELENKINLLIIES